MPSMAHRKIYHDHFLFTAESLTLLVAQQASVVLAFDFVDAFYDTPKRKLLRRTFNHPGTRRRFGLSSTSKAARRMKAKVLSTERSSAMHMCWSTFALRVLSLATSTKMGRSLGATHAFARSATNVTFRHLHSVQASQPRANLVDRFDLPNASGNVHARQCRSGPHQWSPSGYYYIENIRASWMAALKVDWSPQSKVIAFLAKRKLKVFEGLRWVESWMRETPVCDPDESVW